MESNKEITVDDVGSVVEAISIDEGNSAPLYQVESLCMRCNKNVGTTTFLMTSIPHFRQVLLSSFRCPHCHESNNEVQFAGEIQPKGCHYRLEVPSGDQKMLSRQVVKSESATIKIPELDFEIPPEAQRGSLSTVEGVLVRAIDELQALQEERKKVDPQTAEAIYQFLLKLRACATGELPFTFILDDPAGNSFIENPFAPSPDPSLSIKFYDRTPEQQASLGYLVDSSQVVESSSGASMGETSNTVDQVRRQPHGSVGAVAGQRAIAQSNSAEIAEALFRYSAPEEVMTFPSTCGACAARCETRMFVTRIPYFQEVIVMASTCDDCGYRNSELKPGGPISEKGKRVTLCVENINDLSRDVIKSDTASVKVPELDLELASGTLGGIVTTVEGLSLSTALWSTSQPGCIYAPEQSEAKAFASCSCLMSVILLAFLCLLQRLERVHGFTFGDSLDEGKKAKWLDFKARLNKILSMEEPWTLILDDALANSFIAPATDDIKDDHQLMFEEYERSWEQNEELGLNDMDTSSADAAYQQGTLACTPLRLGSFFSEGGGGGGLLAAAVALCSPRLNPSTAPAKLSVTLLLQHKDWEYGCEPGIGIGIGIGIGNGKPTLFGEPLEKECEKEYWLIWHWQWGSIEELVNWPFFTLSS
ncbi:Zinc finger, ZPR1-type [Corchorus olitorius]|uniref:Zinc finger, ZPR1-type n=1 Tax=Corchorus olitorius TaxID=93759 RepID=A0A1R3KHI0_9ROSI|nr:Zinc finger, ZPR1-type [Corchorus olitorius]